VGAGEPGSTPKFNAVGGSSSSTGAAEDTVPMRQQNTSSSPSTPPAVESFMRTLAEFVDPDTLGPESLLSSSEVADTPTLIATTEIKGDGDPVSSQVAVHEPKYLVSDNDGSLPEAESMAAKDQLAESQAAESAWTIEFVEELMASVEVRSIETADIEGDQATRQSGQVMTFDQSPGESSAPIWHSTLEGHAEPTEDIFSVRVKRAIRTIWGKYRKASSGSAVDPSEIQDTRREVSFTHMDEILRAVHSELQKDSR
jgi:hypothetical protein